MLRVMRLMSVKPYRVKTAQHVRISSTAIRVIALLTITVSTVRRRTMTVRVIIESCVPMVIAWIDLVSRQIKPIIRVLVTMDGHNPRVSWRAR